MHTYLLKILCMYNPDSIERDNQCIELSSGEQI